jgi:uncharacterized peroxidase-related enzyme
MAHIRVNPDSVGIRSLFEFRPESAAPLLQLAETLLRSENSLTRVERELIASYVSHLNECNFCELSHSCFAGLELDENWDLVDATLENPESAPISDKLKALLQLASLVRISGKAVTAKAIERAKLAGASEVEIHDTVLIAAAFCMFNRYVDGLGASSPASRGDYIQAAREIVTRGYLRPSG